MRMERNNYFFVGELFPRRSYGCADGGRMMRIVVVHQSPVGGLAVIFEPPPRPTERRERLVRALGRDVGESRSRGRLRGTGVHAIELADEVQTRDRFFRVIDDARGNIFEDRRDIRLARMCNDNSVPRHNFYLPTERWPPGLCHAKTNRSL